MASTTPAPSSPSTIGTGTPFQLPSAACRQLWHTPLAVMRTSTSPARGASSSTSSTWSGLPRSNRTEARIGPPSTKPRPPRARSRAGSAAVPDPGIQIAVEQVDGEVDGHEHEGDEEDRALDQRVVAL